MGSYLLGYVGKDFSATVKISMYFRVMLFYGNNITWRLFVGNQIFLEKLTHSKRTPSTSSLIYNTRDLGLVWFYVICEVDYLGPCVSRCLGILALGGAMRARCGAGDAVWLTCVVPWDRFVRPTAIT